MKVNKQKLALATWASLMWLMAAVCIVGLIAIMITDAVIVAAITMIVITFFIVLMNAIVAMHRYSLIQDKKKEGDGGDDNEGIESVRRVQVPRRIIYRGVHPLPESGDTHDLQDEEEVVEKDRAKGLHREYR